MGRSAVNRLRRCAHFVNARAFVRYQEGRKKSNIKFSLLSMKLLTVRKMLQKAKYDLQTLSVCHL
jgi:hypothetical protein